MALPSEKYITEEYFQNNPSWDLEDSPWKAEAVASFLEASKLSPRSICEIGCGAGGVLSVLRHKYPSADLYGYDIAPAAAGFWQKYQGQNIEFVQGDFFALNKTKYDLILLLDVIEHIGDPFTFLNDLHGFAAHYLFHIPLDLSAASVARETPLLAVRSKVGHVNYFTKTLALEILKECGFEIVRWKYSGAAFNAPQRTWKTRLAAIPRLVAYALHKDWGVRILGGETLLVLARSGGGKHGASGG